MDFLKSAVASAMAAKGPPFPYTFGDKVDLDPSIWTLYNGTRRVCPKPSLYPSTSSMASASGASPDASPAFLGRRIGLQHIRLRRNHPQILPAPGEECAEEASDAATSRRGQGLRYCRGTLANNNQSLRHPRRGRQRLTSGRDPEQTDTYIYIATERLVPLRWHVKRKSLSPETAKWGLCSIAVSAN